MLADSLRVGTTTVRCRGCVPSAFTNFGTSAADWSALADVSAARADGGTTVLKEGLRIRKRACFSSTTSVVSTRICRSIHRREWIAYRLRPPLKLREAGVVSGSNGLTAIGQADVTVWTRKLRTTTRAARPKVRIA